ncbi:MAG TPA: glutathione S-transferase N-terminal domain-containing protein [Gammaproteobacteria bacterium]|nr:glutathione S-transferase N-terminal domain-containing protein [Gammaproteobacteria bacterium]
MIDLYYWTTPNGWKVSIMLEECGLEYKVVPVDIGAGEQFRPEFLKISPNNRMPAIVDHEPLGGGEPLSLFESGAILEYLADKTGRFLPAQAPDRYRVLQWVHWQMANLGPMMGNANHFRNYAKNIVDDPKQLEYGERRFTGEVDRLCGVMDAQLLANRYLAGDEYSIADIISWPWAMLAGGLMGEAIWETFPSLKRWVGEVGGRPAVQTGRELGREWSQHERTEEEKKRRRELLFNQTSEKVRKAREEAAKAAR